MDQTNVVRDMITMQIGVLKDCKKEAEAEMAKQKKENEKAAKEMEKMGMGGVMDGMAGVRYQMPDINYLKYPRCYLG